MRRVESQLAARIFHRLTCALHTGCSLSDRNSHTAGFERIGDMAFRNTQDNEPASDYLTQDVLDAGRAIVKSLLNSYRGRVAIRLWDGHTVGSTSAPTCTLVFREPGPLRDLLLHQDLLRLVGDYLDGRVDVEGDMEALFELTPVLESLHLSLLDKARLLRYALRLPGSTCVGRDSVRRMDTVRRDNSRTNIAHHYDVGNAFYALWLDPERVYSCAYFRDDEQDLAAAQRDKLDYICRKLRLAPGQSLLDIGCGWGALACWAARNYGVKVHGITLSDAQYRYASERARNEGLTDCVEFEIRDYRDLRDCHHYDRVVSVGMFEHVGVKNFPSYFQTVRRVLKPDGLFLNHGITSRNGWRSGDLTAFMNHYIFPDGELARVCDVMDAMERAGFEVMDAESLRRHYVLTLRHWVQALVSDRDRAIAASSEEVYRLWRLYMAGCAYNFSQGDINVYQLLAGCARNLSQLPFRRDDLYMRNGC